MSEKRANANMKTSYEFLGENIISFRGGGRTPFLTDKTLTPLLIQTRMAKNFNSNSKQGKIVHKIVVKREIAISIFDLN